MINYAHAVKKIHTFSSKEMPFFKKDEDSMKNTVSWKEFSEITDKIKNEYKKMKMESPFLKYTFGDRTFIKVPGFDEGSCLWAHLGIPPDELYTIIGDCADNILQDSTMGKNSEFATEAIEMVDVLDPSENIVNAFKPEIREDPVSTLQMLRTPHIEPLCRSSWKENLKKHGGARIEKNNFAFRPPNSDRFFQKTAEYLNVKIVIFTPDSGHQNLKNLKEFVCDSDCTLYLMQDAQGHGSHYDILVEQGVPVSMDIIEEMEYYLEEQKTKTDSNKKNIIKK